MNTQEEKIRLENEYPYAFARVSAMKSKLLKKSDFDKLLKMKESEIAKYLQDFEYKQQINKLGVQYSGVALIERAIRDNHTDTLKKLLKISEGSLKEIIKAYLKKEDIFNIKTIIRGKFTKTSNEDIRKLLIPVGELNIESLNKLLQLEDIEKILVVSKLAKYDEIKQALKVFKDKKQLEIIEFAIDKVFYKKIIEFVDTLDTDAKVIKDFLAGEIDATNIKIILKFKREKVSEEVIRNLLFISKASKIPKSKWEKIIQIKSIEQISKEFENTPYAEIIRKGIEELSKKDTLSEIDISLQRYLLSRTQTKNHQNPLSVDVILSFMFAKEVEIRNIYLMIKSKQLGLKEEFIQKQLII